MGPNTTVANCSTRTGDLEQYLLRCFDFALPNTHLCSEQIEEEQEYLFAEILKEGRPNLEEVR